MWRSKGFWGLAIVAQFLLSSLLLVLLIVGSSTEGELFPVSENWRVTRSWRVGPDLWVEGVVSKCRECEYLYPTIAAPTDGGKPVPVYSTSPSSKNSWPAECKPRPFGPWMIPDSAGKEFDFYQRHSCHKLWNTTTFLGTFSDAEKDSK